MLNYAPDTQTKYLLKEADQSFGEWTSAHVNSSNVPDLAPPEVERLVLQGSKKRVGIANSRIQASMNFEDSGKDGDQTLEVCFANLRKFLVATKKFRNDQPVIESGLVLTLAYPVDKKETYVGTTPLISQALAEHFYKGEQLGSAHTFDMKISFRTEDQVFRSLMINQYEKRGGMIRAIGNTAMVDLAKMDLIEFGVQLILDINDKPLVGTDHVSDVNGLLKNLGAFYKESTSRKFLSSLEF